jgi:hypothetical protein
MSLTEFEVNCRAAHAGQRVFAEIRADQQLEWLRQVEHTRFFESLQHLTVLGALTMPQYGGNRNGLGWQLIGFKDMHAFTSPYGYYVITRVSARRYRHDVCQRSQARAARAHVHVETERIGAGLKVRVAVGDVGVAPHVEATCLDVPRAAHRIRQLAD